MTVRNYAVFDRFDFEYKPVAVKFLLNKPDNIRPYEGNAPICRMFKEAQDNPPFYACQDNFSCVDSIVLGMREPDAITESGKIGEAEHIYQEARANARIYGQIKRIPSNTVRYVAFSALDEVPFTPDLIIFTALPSQAEILFRALSYSTGKPISSVFTPVLMCGWIFSYPFVTGELNYVVTGINYGMKSQKTFPEGLFLLSIPWDIIPMLLENLESMEWVLPMFRMNTEEKADYAVQVMDGIRQAYENG
ncbi:MAG: DUF169 domain-containing protein [Dehalococcoidales bacterium]|nr:DUF169 domain-containing protein [Dehalococcoidales bacterium]